MLRVYGAGRGKKTTSESSPDPANEPATGNSSCLIRMQKEISDLELPPGFGISFPDKNNLMKFFITVDMTDGYWKNLPVTFRFVIPAEYPYAAPSVHCETKIFHPNIDNEGNVCLNVLREDWRPVLSILSIVLGILHIMSEPTTDDALNKDAANLLATSVAAFKRKVRQVHSG